MADDKVVKAAQDAWAAGKPHHVAMLTWSAWKSGVNAQPSDWDETLHHVVAMGWRLTGWSVVADHRGNPAAFALLGR